MEISLGSTFSMLLLTQGICNRLINEVIAQLVYQYCKCINYLLHTVTRVPHPRLWSRSNNSLPISSRGRRNRRLRDYSERMGRSYSLNQIMLRKSTVKGNGSTNLLIQIN